MPVQLKPRELTFVQADSSTTRIFGGTGLGLSLSRKLAKALGGDIVLTSSEPGKGSVFTVTIDAGPQETASFLPLESQMKGSSLTEANAAENSFPLADATILLVEDSPENRLIASRLLTSAGARVDLAVDGEDGVLKALAKPYDVVLMNIQMPRVDGYEALAKLREQGVKTAVFAVTAHAMRGDREHAISEGFDDYVTKPIDRKLLIKKISDILSTKGGSVHESKIPL